MIRITEIIKQAQEKRRFLNKESMTRKKKNRAPNTEYGDILRKRVILTQQVRRLKDQKEKKRAERADSASSKDPLKACQGLNLENLEPQKRRVELKPLDKDNLPEKEPRANSEFSEISEYLLKACQGLDQDIGDFEHLEPFKKEEGPSEKAEPMISNGYGWLEAFRVNFRQFLVDFLSK